MDFESGWNEDTCLFVCLFSVCLFSVCLFFVCLFAFLAFIQGQGLFLDTTPLKFGEKGTFSPTFFLILVWGLMVFGIGI